MSPDSQDSARPVATTRVGAFPESLCSLSLRAGPGLETSIHTWDRVPQVVVLVAQSFGFPLLQVSRLALSGLRNWTTAASPSAVFAARHFRPFLPPRSQVELGEPWWIIPSELSVFTGYLSNNRFYPPPPKGKEVRAAPALAQAQPPPLYLAPHAAPPALSFSLGPSLPWPLGLQVPS